MEALKTATASLAEIYSGKTVLLTGHTGFKGSWLSLWLSRLGAKVVGYSLPPPTEPSLFQDAGIGILLEDIRADIRNTERLTEVIALHRPDAIFHLAAQPLVLDAYGDPVGTFDINLMGTVSLLEAVRRADISCGIVAVTTDKVYENFGWDFAYRENDMLGGYDPYSASKATAEIAIASYRRSFFAASGSKVRLASVRAGNVIGGGDWSANRIVPDIVRALVAGRDVTVRSPKAIRPWQHVLEPLLGYLMVGAKLLQPDAANYTDAWNFGPAAADVRRVSELVDAFVKAWGEGKWVDASDPNAPHEAAILKLAIDKAIDRLGWRPVWGFADTVSHTANWYRRTAGAPGQALQACLDDIAAYESGMRDCGLGGV